MTGNCDNTDGSSLTYQTTKNKFSPWAVCTPEFHRLGRLDLPLGKFVTGNCDSTDGSSLTCQTTKNKFSPFQNVLLDMVKLFLEKLASAASVSVTGEWKMNGEKKKQRLGRTESTYLNLISNGSLCQKG